MYLSATLQLLVLQLQVSPLLKATQFSANTVVGGVTTSDLTVAKSDSIKSVLVLLSDLVTITVSIRTNTSMQILHHYTDKPAAITLIALSCTLNTITERCYSFLKSVVFLFKDNLPYF